MQKNQNFLAMIIGLLISLFFGGANIEVFYLDKIEKGVKEYVVDKDRRKELEGMLKAYTVAAKDFSKKREKALKILKKKNLDRTTSKEWYDNFLEERLDEHKILQEQFIDQRLLLQQILTLEEWTQIVELASDEATKIEVKEKKKQTDSKNKSLFRDLEKALNTKIADDHRRSVVADGLEGYEKSYDEISRTIDNIDVNHTGFLSDQNATKEEMMKFSSSLND